MSKRQEVRVPKHLKVTVRGKDRFGNPFQQTATTLDVSRYGARLDGLACVGDAQTVEVKCGWFRKAKFKVVWAGSPGTAESAQVGIQSLDPNKNLWDMEFPPPQTTSYTATTRTKKDRETDEESTLPESGPIPVKFEAAGAGPIKYEAPPTFEGPSGLTQVVADPASAPPSHTKAARAARLERHIPVTIRYKLGGAGREEARVIAQVGGDGSCLVELHVELPQGAPVEIIHGYSQQSRPGRVVMSSTVTARGTHSVAIDLVEPDPAFWNAKPQFR